MQGYLGFPPRGGQAWHARLGMACTEGHHPFAGVWRCPTCCRMCSDRKEQEGLGLPPLLPMPGARFAGYPEPATSPSPQTPNMLRADTTGLLEHGHHLPPRPTGAWVPLRGDHQVSHETGWLPAGSKGRKLGHAPTVCGAVWLRPAATSQHRPGHASTRQSGPSLASLAQQCPPPQKCLDVEIGPGF